MKKTIIALVVVFSPLIAFAEMTISVAVPDHCTVVDTEGVSHAYSGYLGICALQAALDAGSISGAQFSNAFPSLGLFVTSIGGIAADPSSQYWALYQNGNFASVGLSQLPIIAHDSITLELHDFSDTFLGSRFTLTIDSLALSGTSASPTGGGSRPPPSLFSVPAALSFLAAMQNSDGSFGPDFISDWAAIAIASASPSDTRVALGKYLLKHAPTLNSVTDYERHAMALMALGINPYSDTGTDYVMPIVAAFDGTQIGESSLVNDDIFALFPLPKAGFSATDGILQKTIAFILTRQKPNGSWEESVDLTAAAIQALTQFSSVTGISDALAKARAYLHSAQDTTGGWKNSFSTSWALQAIHALGESLPQWTESGSSPLNFLGVVQLSDGGVEPTSTDDATRIWATAYAIPAALGKPWNTILRSFPKPENPIATRSMFDEGGLVAGVATSIVPSLDTSTTTPLEGPVPATELTVLSTDVVKSDLEAQSAAVIKQTLPANTPATSSAATSTQVAVASRSASGTVEIWIWFSGLALIFFSVFYFLRRA